MCLFSLSGKETYCDVQSLLQLNVGVLFAPSVFLLMYCECYVLPLTLHNGTCYAVLIRCNFQKALQLPHVRQFSNVRGSDKPPPHTHTRVTDEMTVAERDAQKDAGRAT